MERNVNVVYNKLTMQWDAPFGVLMSVCPLCLVAVSISIAITLDSMLLHVYSLQANKVVVTLI